MEGTVETIEGKTAKTILQQEETVVIGGKTYKVAPPSIATLILASEAVSKLPTVNLDNDNIVAESLYIAKDCKALGEILAILILGAKKILRGKIFFWSKWQKTLLADKILKETSPKQLNELLGRLLSSMELAFFFATTISLIEINLLQATRQKATTASGR
ncbi:MAG: hypothetical protein FWF52_04240 [Candidatus Azobacteroides sp.]|nr:hypothetical protein [Candidatus Azobacteroides sp.]